MKSKGDKFEYLKEDCDEPGSVFVKLLRTLKEIQLGKLDDTFSWREHVEEPAPNQMEQLRAIHADNKDKAIDQLP